MFMNHFSMSLLQRALLITCLLLTANSAYAVFRDWEQWDKDDVSEVIDLYWLSSQEELEHRKRLAALMRQWLLPHERLLEVGSGSGLVYHQLVPNVLPNDAYVGVDISDTMLDIATKRFPEAVFIKGDAYALPFLDSSFDIVAAFEVFGHIGDIKKPIMEMFRTTSRLVIFSVWVGPKTKVEREVIKNSVFIHTTFSHEDVMKAIDNALQTESYTVHAEPLPGDKVAYIIHR